MRPNMLFYLIPLLWLLLGGVIWLDHRLQQQIATQQRALITLESKAKELLKLSRQWKEKNLQHQRFQNFTQYVQPFIQTSTKHTLHLTNIGAKDADRIADKLLNSYIRIKRITIRRDSNKQLTMEIER